MDGRGFTIPSVLTIAGSDSSGGAGIQADIKTIEAMGLFAQSAITALTAQNTLGVSGVLETPVDFISAQIDAVFSDIRPSAVKVGMVPSPDAARTITERLRHWEAQNIVVDPVMVSTSGSRLMDEGAEDTVVGILASVADVLTPNIPEAQALLGLGIDGASTQAASALELCRQLGCAVLVKGGHGVQDANDALALPDADRGEVALEWIYGERVETPNTHGTGCTLSSAIACGLAKGLSIGDSVRAAKEYLSGALASGLDLGAGSGPIDHMWRMRQGL